MKYDYEHAWTDAASVVTTYRDEPYIGRVPLCPSHAAHFAKDSGSGAAHNVAPLAGRHVCAKCVKFTNTDHVKLVAALRVPGAYTRRRGWDGAIGVVYDYDPDSPSGARASGVGFDPFCPHAMDTVRTMARRMEPTRP